MVASRASIIDDGEAVYLLADALRHFAPRDIDRWLVVVRDSKLCRESTVVGHFLDQAEIAAQAVADLSRREIAEETVNSGERPLPGHAPSRAELERGLLLGLGWIAGQRDQFAVPELVDGSFDKDDVARLKPLSELALAIWLLRRSGITMPFLEETAEWIWDQTEHGRAMARLLLARHDFLPSCAIYAMLDQLGYHSALLRATLGYLSRLAIARRLPLQPWAQLALDYHLRQLRLLDKRPPLDGLYVSSRPEPWVISGELGYAITHETFYLSDFGSGEVADRAVADYLLIWLPYWVVVFEAERDWDLVGELSMAARCVGLPVPPAFRSVLAAQDHDGSVPGPEGAGSFLFSAADSAQRRRFLGRYHTTLVTVMAAAMGLADARVGADDLLDGTRVGRPGRPQPADGRR